MSADGWGSNPHEACASQNFKFGGPTEQEAVPEAKIFGDFTALFYSSGTAEL